MSLATPARIKAKLLSESIYSNGCWIWPRAKTSSGYTRYTIVREGKFFQTMAHRVSYELFIGKIPEGYQLDHLCRIRACINPWHLEPVTPAENVRRSATNPATINSKKTHCTNGHSLSIDNIYRPPGTNRRLCRACQTRRSKVYRKRKELSCANAR